MLVGTSPIQPRAFTVCLASTPRADVIRIAASTAVRHRRLVRVRLHETESIYTDWQEPQLTD